MIGKLRGVAKEAHLTMVETGLSAPSLIDAVARVLDTLQKSPFRLQGSKRYTVLSITGIYIPNYCGHLSRNQLKRALCRY